MQPKSSCRCLCLSAALLVQAAVVADAADQVFKAPVPEASAIGPQTLTGDWFDQGPALRAAGFDFRLEWSQFYQGLARGDADGNRRWAYGGKWDALLRVDLSRVGFWNGLSVTAQGTANYGQSANGISGALLPVNAALFFPGIAGADASDIMALFVTQNFGDLVSVRAGKLNFVEIPRATPLRGGGGVDTFWNINLATPISGILPPTINGAMMSINTQPVSFTLMVFDPVNATNRPLFSDLFENGVAVMGGATLRTSAAGLTGFYGINVRYSTKEGPDFSELFPPPGTAPSTKKGSYYVALSMQQFLFQDPGNPARGWGVFGEITTADGNPNPLQWSTHVGIGGNSLIPGRPDDRFGVAYFRFGFSDILKDQVAPVFNLADTSGVEVFYNVAATPWLRVTGNLQFIKPANGDRPDSIYAGLGSYVRF
jgi:porin